MKDRIGPSKEQASRMGGRKQRLRAKVPTQTLKKIRQFSHFFSETALGISFKSAGRRD
jgi:hypothetical protein